MMEFQWLSMRWSKIRVIASVAGCLIAVFFIWYKFSWEIDEEKIYRSANYNHLNQSHHVGKLESRLWCHDNQLEMLIVVTSNVSSFERRHAIRNTWGKSLASKRNDDFKTFFAVGKSYSSGIMQQIKRESDHHKDIIIGDFYETFYHLSYKFEMILEWAYKYCNFRYLLKTDDDVFVNLPNLFDLLNNNDFTQQRQLYLGRAQFYAPVLRSGKYAVKYNEYAKSNYPPFVGGGAVVFSYDVVESVIPYFYSPPFKLEDINIAFLIANTGAPVTHNGRFKLVESHCYWDSYALVMHFQKRWWKNATVCMRELFYTMLALYSITGQSISKNSGQITSFRRFWDMVADLVQLNKTNK